MLTARVIAGKVEGAGVTLTVTVSDDAGAEIARTNCTVDATADGAAIDAVLDSLLVGVKASNDAAVLAKQRDIDAASTLGTALERKRSL